MEFPRITVITPSFNQGKYIGDTINSVKKQNYPNLEYIIIDGGSTDETLEVIKSSCSVISYWVSEPDNGQSHAINKGIARATGDIISWINSDDLMADGALHAIAEAWEENPGVLGVIGRIEMFNEQGVFRRTTSILSSTLEETIGYGKVAQPAMYFSTEAYRNIGLLNEKLHYMMDTEWYLRFLLHYGQDRLIEIDQLIALFRLHESSKTMAMAEKFRLERDSLYYSIALRFGQKEVAEFLLKYAKVNPQISISNAEGDPSIIARVLNYFIYQLGQEYYYYGVTRKCKACFKFVNTEMLSSNDQHKLRKLSFRVNFIPAPVLKFLKTR
jgi:glycosyltransferase involved in cell wall biosynthesis